MPNLEKIYRLVAVWDKLRRKAQEAKFDASSAELDLRAAVAEHFGIDAYDCVLGIHECKDSPTGRCVYNSEEDVCHDDCIVCHDPEERA